MLDDLHVALMIISNRGHRRVPQRADLSAYSWAALGHSGGGRRVGRWIGASRATRRALDRRVAVRHARTSAG